MCVYTHTNTPDHSQNLSNQICIYIYIFVLLLNARIYDELELKKCHLNALYSSCIIME